MTKTQFLILLLILALAYYYLNKEAPTPKSPKNSLKRPRVIVNLPPVQREIFDIDDPYWEWRRPQTPPAEPAYGFPPHTPNEEPFLVNLPSPRFEVDDNPLKEIEKADDKLIKKGGQHD